jgi:hypothetical protein
MQYNLPKVKVVEDIDTLLEEDKEGDDSYDGVRVLILASDNTMSLFIAVLHR